MYYFSYSNDLADGIICYENSSRLSAINSFDVYEMEQLEHFGIGQCMFLSTLWEHIDIGLRPLSYVH